MGHSALFFPYFGFVAGLALGRNGIFIGDLLSDLYFEGMGVLGSPFPCLLIQLRNEE